MQYERQRADFPLLLNEWELLEVGVEVGVCKGELSRQILEFWPGFLHLVDPWAHIPGYEEDYDHGSNYQETLTRLKGFEDRYMIHRKTSLGAAKDFRDNFLDFVYLDANHAYKAVKADIAAWWPKIRPGGMLAGDDYGIVPEQPINFGHGRVMFGVHRAVQEFAKEHRRNISLDIYADWMNAIPGQGELRARGWYCIK